MYKVKYHVKLGYVVVHEDNENSIVFRADQQVCEDFAYIMNGARHMRLEEGKTEITYMTESEPLVKE